MEYFQLGHHYSYTNENIDECHVLTLKRSEFSSGEDPRIEICFLIKGGVQILNVYSENCKNGSERGWLHDLNNENNTKGYSLSADQRVSGVFCCLCDGLIKKGGEIFQVFLFPILCSPCARTINTNSYDQIKKLFGSLVCSAGEA